VQQKQTVQSQFGQIRRALQIFDRRLTQSEERYITKWVEMGFSEPEISLAYERTVLSCGSLKWPYMNSILESWQRQNLYTVEQIESKLRGNTCGMRPTSCADQLSIAVREAYEATK
jgi:DnaD/phage-associated family protein